MKQRISHTILRKEFKFLAGGRRLGKLIVLTGIFGFAVLSLGINAGLMAHLTEKMESPFMRLVEVQNSIGQVSLDSIPLPNEFQASHIPRINYWQNAAFAAIPGQERKLARLFYVEEKNQDSLLTLIQAKDKNFVLGEQDFTLRARHPGAIILTESFAKKIGFLSNPGTGHIQLNQLNTEVDDKRLGIHFPVAAVVEKLPRNADIIITEATWSILKSEIDAPGYTNRFSRDCFIVSANDTTQAKVDYIVIDMERSAWFEESYIITIPPNRIKDSWTKVESIPSTLSIPSNATLSKSYESPSGVFIFFPSENLVSLPGEFDQAIETGFEKMNTDRDPIQLNLTDIESKRNLGIISGLTQILTVAISLLALGFVISFVVNLLLQHIAQNGPNIGTLQAFGISNEYIIIMYSKIGLMLISIAFAAGLVLSFLGGPWVMDVILAQIGLGDEAEHISFTLRNPLLVIVAFIALPMSVVYFSLKSKLSKSKPGDLIYSRNNSTNQ